MNPVEKLSLQIFGCQECELSSLPHRGPVPFVMGTSNIAVVSEAPGSHEVAEGRPLCGPSGRLLDRWLGQAGIDPASVSRFNVVSCYPAGPPSPDHLWSCRHNLQSQIEVLAPRYLLVLGKVAFSRFHSLPIATARGHWWAEGATYCMTTWHPSFVARDGTGVAAKEAAADILLFATGTRLVGPDGFPVGRSTCAVCNGSSTRRGYKSILLCDTCDTAETLLERHFGGCEETAPTPSSAP